jgi:hypothetical protein
MIPEDGYRRPKLAAVKIVYVSLYFVYSTCWFLVIRRQYTFVSLPVIIDKSQRNRNIALNIVIESAFTDNLAL